MYDTLRPLYEEFPTRNEGNQLIKVFFSGFSDGLYMGLIDGTIKLITKSPKRTSKSVNDIIEDATETTNG